MTQRILLIFLPLALLCQLTANAQPLGPAVGSLVIAGGGELDASIIDRFVTLAGGKDAPIVVIPTGMEDARVESADRFLKPFARAGCTNLHILHTRDRQKANSAEFVWPLLEAGGVWFTGGRQWRLADSYLDTRTEEALWDVLERGGVIGGTSAGATILGSFLVRGDTESNAVMVGDHTKGFGFIPQAAIDQHVLARNRHFDLIDVVSDRPNLLGIGIDEGTAIVVHGNEFEVIGDSYVVIVTADLLENGRRFHLLAPGDRFVGPRRWSDVFASGEVEARRQMEGVYDFGNDFVVTIAHDGERLTATRSNSVELIQITPVMYYAPDVDAYHIFESSDSKTFDTLTLRAGTWDAVGRKMLTPAYPDSLCESCAEWDAPQDPFRIHSNTFYVGPRGLSVILITSPAGHVLIDGALPSSAPRIMDNIRALGFEPTDIKLILNSHAHFDHAGGIAAIQRASGARVAASPRSASALERGSSGPEDPQYGILLDFPPVANVERFSPGDTIRLGTIELFSHATAGHTPGGTSWSWRSCDTEGCVDVVYADSQTPVSADGFRFTDSESYPSAVQDLEHGHKVLESLPCDILITTHPDASGFWARLTEGREGLIDPDACKMYAARSRKQLQERLRKEAQTEKRSSGEE